MVRTDEAPALELRDVRKDFGRVAAVDGVHLSIDRGEVVALLGPNGAGKSTTIDLLLGLSRPSSGEVRLFGGAVQAAVDTGRVGAMLQHNGLPDDVTVAELLQLYATLHRHPLTPAEVLRRAGIEDLAKRRAARLSGGQQQRVRFALSVVTDPELLVLDEPTAAMDVQARRGFWASMRELTSAGRTVLFATHHLDEADEHADQVVVMDRGRVVADGLPAAGAGRRGPWLRGQGHPGRSACRRGPAGPGRPACRRPEPGGGEPGQRRQPADRAGDRGVGGGRSDGTAADVAAALGLSEGTVRNHLSSAIGKTGARTRAEAALIAEQRGWL
jgi:ABC-type multidrug transport system ATPase subunit